MCKLKKTEIPANITADERRAIMFNTLSSLDLNDKLEKRENDKLTQQTDRKSEQLQKAEFIQLQPNKKISAANLGRTQSDATKLRISQGNTGKKRTPEMKKAQSDRMKGIEPKAASEGVRKWRETHGGGYWGSHKIPDAARANMKLAQQKRGTAVRAFAPDGTWQDFNTMNDAAKALGMNPGSIANNLKSKGVQ